jgi:hypothetical protein
LRRAIKSFSRSASASYCCFCDNSCCWSRGHLVAFFFDGGFLFFDRFGPGFEVGQHPTVSGIDALELILAIEKLIEVLALEQHGPALAALLPLQKLKSGDGAGAHAFVVILSFL